MPEYNSRNSSLRDRIKTLMPSHVNQPNNLYEPSVPRLPEPVDDSLFETDPDSTGSFPVEDQGQRRNIVDPSFMQQPAYDDNNIQMMSDVASDESLPVLSYYIQNLANLGDKAQGRLIARASAYQSKNQVFSNITDLRDYLMAQDDYEFSKILSTSDFTCFDMNTDYYVAESIMEGQFNIRLRRSRKALALQMLNTTRSEQSMSGGQQQREEHSMWNKIPFLGGGGRG